MSEDNQEIKEKGIVCGLDVEPQYKPSFIIDGDRAFDLYSTEEFIQQFSITFNINRVVIIGGDNRQKQILHLIKECKNSYETDLQVTIRTFGHKMPLYELSHYVNYEVIISKERGLPSRDQIEFFKRRTQSNFYIIKENQNRVSELDEIINSLMLPRQRVVLTQGQDPSAEEQRELITYCFNNGYKFMFTKSAGLD